MANDGALTGVRVPEYVAGPSTSPFLKPENVHCEMMKWADKLKHLESIGASVFGAELSSVDSGAFLETSIQNISHSKSVAVLRGFSHHDTPLEEWTISLEPSRNYFEVLERRAWLRSLQAAAQRGESSDEDEDGISGDAEEKNGPCDEQSTRNLNAALDRAASSKGWKAKNVPGGYEMCFEDGSVSGERGPWLAGGPRPVHKRFQWATLKEPAHGTEPALQWPPGLFSLKAEEKSQGVQFDDTVVLKGDKKESKTSLGHEEKGFKQFERGKVSEEQSVRTVETKEISSWPCGSLTLPHPDGADEPLGGWPGPRSSTAPAPSKAEPKPRQVRYHN